MKEFKGKAIKVSPSHSGIRGLFRQFRLMWYAHIIIKKIETANSQSVCMLGLGDLTSHVLEVKGMKNTSHKDFRDIEMDVMSMLLILLNGKHITCMAISDVEVQKILGEVETKKHYTRYRVRILWTVRGAVEDLTRVQASNIGHGKKYRLTSGGGSPRRVRNTASVVRSIAFGG